MGSAAAAVTTAPFVEEPCCAGRVGEKRLPSKVVETVTGLWISAA
jgi:hypothetical protein